MASYPDPRYTTTFEVFNRQDGACDDAVSMQRSVSQSTSCTVDSSYTTSTSFSGCSSATDYSSIDPVLVENAAHWESSSYPHMLSPNEPQDNNHILYETGSQYHQSGHQFPQALYLTSPLQPPDSAASIEQLAWQATLMASSLIINQQPFGDGEPSVIRSEAVEKAIRRHQAEGNDEPVRPAVQDVLREQLLRQAGRVYFHAETISILEEAAYQLQIRLQGPKVIDICYFAILTVLAQLPTDPGSQSNDAGSQSIDLQSYSSSAARQPTEKEKHLCPKCGKGSSRQADVERHYRIVHLKEEEKTKYLCDYKRCGRHKAPFFRQDHFRDHLRIYHKEDLLRRGNKGDEDDEWWDSRAPRALYGDWWRCSRCLIRVGHATYGFTCPGCGNPCESERQRHRLSRRI